MKILRPISYLEVAGIPRNRPEKTGGLIGERESRERGERNFLPEMETSISEVSLNINSPK